MVGRANFSDAKKLLIILEGFGFAGMNELNFANYALAKLATQAGLEIHVAIRHYLECDLPAVTHRTLFYLGQGATSIVFTPVKAVISLISHFKTDIALNLSADDKIMLIEKILPRQEFLKLI